MFTRFVRWLTCKPTTMGSVQLVFEVTAVFVWAGVTLVVGVVVLFDSPVLGIIFCAIHGLTAVWLIGVSYEKVERFGKRPWTWERWFAQGFLGVGIGATIMILILRLV